MSECNCTLRETVVGDGCRYCNPQFLIDHLADERDEQTEEIEQLQARVKELEAENAGLREKLWRIANPLRALASDAEAQGYKLDGAAAVSIARDVETLKQWAAEAIAPHQPAQSEGE